MEDTQTREFKGVWISKDIWLNDKLNALEKFLLAEIDSLSKNGLCYASNDYLAKFCMCSERTISRSLARLQELNLITIDNSNNKFRVININIDNVSRQNVYDTTTKCLPINIIDNKENNNIDIITKESSTKTTTKTKKTYGSLQNVKLTDEEYANLQTKFPTDYEDRVESASLYLASKGDKYKSHYAMLLNWARMDAKRNTNSKPKQQIDIPLVEY